jgi:uncharacterized protein (TIGR03067 family)
MGQAEEPKAMRFPLTLLCGCAVLGMTAVALGPAAQPEGAKEADRAKAKQEEKKLQGTWRVVAITAGGKKVAEERVRQINLRWEFDGPNWLVKRPDRDTRHWKFTIDPTHTPPRMTSLGQDQKGRLPPLKAIYVLKGNQLQVCMMVDEKQFGEFPAAMESTRSPTTDLITLEREPEKK